MKKEKITFLPVQLELMFFTLKDVISTSGGFEIGDERNDEFNQWGMNGGEN